MLVLAACGSLPAAAWAVDNTPPTVTFTGGVGVAPHLTNAAVPEVSFTAGDASGIQSVQCKVDATVYADCSSPYAMPGLAEGGHTVFVKATDASAVHNAFTQSAAFIVDRTKPVVDLPDPITANDTVSWGYSDAHGPVTSTCAIAPNAPAPCTTASTLDVLPLAPGIYSLALRVTDGAGNFTDRTATVTIDRGAPTVVVGTGPSTATPSKEVRPSFGLTFTDDSGVVSAQCAIDGLPSSDCMDTATTGSFTPASDLSDGGHVFEVVAKDGANKTATAFRSFVVDATPPVVTFDGQSGAYLNGALGFTASDALSPQLTLTCEGAVVLNPCDPPISLAGLGDGDHTIVVHATDAAGNTTTTAPFLVRVDRTPPDLALTSIQVDGSTATVNFTSADAAFPASVTRQCRLDGGAFGPCSSASSHTVGDLAPGPHAVEVLVSDGAGNTSLGRGEFTIGEPPAGTTTTTGTPGTTTTTTAGGTLGDGTGGDTSTDTSPDLSARLKIDRPKGGATRNRLLVKCDEACALTVTLSDRNGKRLVRVTKQLLKGKQAAILLRVSASAFKGKRSLRVKLALRAVDKAGNPTTESRFITLRR
jgi:hypothetical protein